MDAHLSPTDRCKKILFGWEHAGYFTLAGRFYDNDLENTFWEHQFQSNKRNLRVGFAIGVLVLSVFVGLIAMSVFAQPVHPPNFALMFWPLRTMTAIFPAIMLMALMTKLQHKALRKMFVVLITLELITLYAAILVESMAYAEEDPAAVGAFAFWTMLWSLVVAFPLGVEVFLPIVCTTFVCTTLVKVIMVSLGAIYMPTFDVIVGVPQEVLNYGSLLFAAFSIEKQYRLTFLAMMQANVAIKKANFVSSTLVGTVRKERSVQAIFELEKDKNVIERGSFHVDDIMNWFDGHVDVTALEESSHSLPYKRLGFADSSREREYQRWVSATNRTFIELSIVAFVTVHAMFGILDAIWVPQYVKELLVLRLGVGVVVGSTGFMFLQSMSFVKYHNQVLVFGSCVLYASMSVQMYYIPKQYQTAYLSTILRFTLHVSVSLFLTSVSGIVFFAFLVPGMAVPIFLGWWDYQLFMMMLTATFLGAICAQSLDRRRRVVYTMQLRMRQATAGAALKAHESVTGTSRAPFPRRSSLNDKETAIDPPMMTPREASDHEMTTILWTRRASLQLMPHQRSDGLQNFNDHVFTEVLPIQYLQLAQTLSHGIKSSLVGLSLASSLDSQLEFRDTRWELMYVEWLCAERRVQVAWVSLALAIFELVGLSVLLAEPYSNRTVMTTVIWIRSLMAFIFIVGGTAVCALRRHFSLVVGSMVCACLALFAALRVVQAVMMPSAPWMLSDEWFVLMCIMYIFLCTPFPMMAFLASLLVGVEFLIQLFLMVSKEDYVRGTLIILSLIPCTAVAVLGSVLTDISMRSVFWARTEGTQKGFAVDSVVDTNKWTGKYENATLEEKFCTQRARNMASRVRTGGLLLAALNCMLAIQDSFTLDTSFELVLVLSLRLGILMPTFFLLDLGSLARLFFHRMQIVVFTFSLVITLVTGLLSFLVAADPQAIISNRAVFFLTVVFISYLGVLRRVAATTLFGILGVCVAIAFALKPALFDLIIACEVLVFAFVSAINAENLQRRYFWLQVLLATLSGKTYEEWLSEEQTRATLERLQQYDLSLDDLAQLGMHDDTFGTVELGTITDVLGSHQASCSEGASMSNPCIISAELTESDDRQPLTASFTTDDANTPAFNVCDEQSQDMVQDMDHAFNCEPSSPSRSEEVEKKRFQLHEAFFGQHRVNPALIESAKQIDDNGPMKSHVVIVDR